jgi:hypothetical protein
MFIMWLPKSFKLGDTADVKINGKPEKLTWRDAETLVIHPDDARTILQIADEGDLNAFTCGDAATDEQLTPFSVTSLSEDGTVKVRTYKANNGDEVVTLAVRWLEQEDGSSIIVAKKPHEVTAVQQRAIDIAIANGVLELSGDYYALSEKGWAEVKADKTANPTAVKTAAG